MTIRDIHGEDTLRDEIEDRVERELAEKQTVSMARDKWYSQPDKPSRQLALTSEERKWLARHVRYLREAGKNALQLRRNANKVSPEREAWAKWHEHDDVPRKPSRQMGLTQWQRDYLARQLRWLRNNPGPTPDEVKARHDEAWMTGRPDPSLPEWITID